MTFRFLNINAPICYYIIAKLFVKSPDASSNYSDLYLMIFGVMVASIVLMFVSKYLFRYSLYAIRRWYYFSQVKSRA
jgi:hypothetical protein